MKTTEDHILAHVWIWTSKIPIGSSDLPSKNAQSSFDWKGGNAHGKPDDKQSKCYYNL